MREGFRQCMAWLHTWAGLLVGWVLLLVFTTGTAGYFKDEITRWMRPELPLRVPQRVDAIAAVRTAQTYMQRNGSSVSAWSIDLPGARGDGRIGISWRDATGHEVSAEPEHHRRVLDPVTGAPVSEGIARATGGGDALYRLHFALHYMSEIWGLWIVGTCTMFMWVAIVTGVITHKKIFADFFTFRPGKGQRSWLDAHNALGVLALPFFVMITYSGLVFTMEMYVPAAVQAVYGTGEKGVLRYREELFPGSTSGGHSGARVPLVPLETLVQQAEAKWGVHRVGAMEVSYLAGPAAHVTIVSEPAGAGEINAPVLRFDGTTGREIPSPDTTAIEVVRTLLALHEGRFSGPVLRWVYFISGVMGIAMIATGLVLWTVKRRARHSKRGQAGFGLLLVERLNVGSVVGLPAAVAVYFWANRVIPAQLEGRETWEMHAFFVTWATLLLYPAFRPVMLAWVEELWFAAALYGALPVLNALMTRRHLGVTVPAGDWVLAGFDLTMLGLSAAFAFMAMKVARCTAAQSPRTPKARDHGIASLSAGGAAR